MSRIKNPFPVKYFSAILFTPDFWVDEVHSQLIEILGSMDHTSPIFDFGYTDYYEEEMGASLKKQFVSFERLRPPDEIASIKLKTNAIEEQFMAGGRRRVNLDPGYIEEAKMILATTKNFSHRIYLKNGIYGDLQYRFRGGAYTFLEWTYPDYKDEIAVTFFREIRKIYGQQLEKGQAKG